MNVNFFSWIREGVRQAVLHGVSDAVGHIGAPIENDDMPKRLLDIIRQNDPALAAAATTGTPRVEGAASTPRTRKLGRSLEQIVADKND
jgi:hypothetical protein